FRPHFWLADEWFTPDGVPGIAIPFYLAHPRLAKLELAQMLEVEGGDPDSCLRILRHEAGHAIDNAYLLRRRPTRRRLFGTPATEYPEYYTPKPYSKSFVHHLDHWYAQSHPDEDFVSAKSSSTISITGTRKAIRTRTSPKRSPCGSIPRRCGRRATPGGRHSASSNTWIG